MDRPISSAGLMKKKQQNLSTTDINPKSSLFILHVPVCHNNLVRQNWKKQLCFSACHKKRLQSALAGLSELEQFGRKLLNCPGNVRLTTRRIIIPTSETSLNSFIVSINLSGFLNSCWDGQFFFKVHSTSQQIKCIEVSQCLPVPRWAQSWHKSTLWTIGSTVYLPDDRHNTQFFGSDLKLWQILTQIRDICHKAGAKCLLKILPHTASYPFEA